MKVFNDDRTKWVEIEEDFKERVKCIDSPTLWYLFETLVEMRLQVRQELKERGEI